MWSALRDWDAGWAVEQVLFKEAEASPAEAGLFFVRSKPQRCDLSLDVGLWHFADQQACRELVRFRNQSRRSDIAPAPLFPGAHAPKGAMTGAKSRRSRD